MQGSAGHNVPFHLFHLCHSDGRTCLLQRLRGGGGLQRLRPPVIGEIRASWCECDHPRMNITMYAQSQPRRTRTATPASSSAAAPRPSSRPSGPAGGRRGGGWWPPAARARGRRRAGRGRGGLRRAGPCGGRLILVGVFARLGRGESVCGCVSVCVFLSVCLSLYVVVCPNMYHLMLTSPAPAARRPPARAPAGIRSTTGPHPPPSPPG